MLVIYTYVVDCIVGRIFFHSLWFILSFCSNSRMYISLQFGFFGFCSKNFPKISRVFQMGSLDSPSGFLRRSIILKYKKVSQRVCKKKLVGKVKAVTKAKLPIFSFRELVTAKRKMMLAEENFTLNVLVQKALESWERRFQLFGEEWRIDVSAVKSADF